MPHNTAEIGRLIRQARKAAGLSQAELAARTGLRQTWISQVENDKPTAEIGLVFRVLNALGITLAVQGVPALPAEEEAAAEPTARMTLKRYAARPIRPDLPAARMEKPPSMKSLQPKTHIDLNAHLEGLRRKPGS